MLARNAFILFLAIRLASVFLVVTWYVPDEYWQSLEVAHRFVYGYGYLTWEWSQGIRSYIHPMGIAFIYKILNWTGIDSVDLLITAPRILQAILSAYSDYSFWKWCGKSKWSIFCITTSWFWFYTGSRTLLNTLETSLTTIALSKFPFQNAKVQHRTTNDGFIWLVGLVCAIRPTAAILWLPLCVYHLHLSKETLVRNIIEKYLPISIITLALSCLIDSVAHGSFILTWYEFLKINVFSGIGEFYGLQPWHWYLSQGLPAVLGIYMIPFLLASINILKKRKILTEELVLLATITFTITIYSCLGHKEFRFILPLLPIALHLTASYLSDWSRKANEMLIWSVASIILISNLIPAIYLSQYHQRGVLDVFKPIREIALRESATASFLFLMPCHSTPFYSHLHQNVTARFLTCNPNLSGIENYVDEADVFYKSPSAWLRNNYPPDRQLPSHIITFDRLVPYLSDILSRYKPVQRIFHSHTSQGDERVGSYVILHERIDFD